MQVPDFHETEAISWGKFPSCASSIEAEATGASRHKGDSAAREDLPGSSTMPSYSETLTSSLWGSRQVADSPYREPASSSQPPFSGATSFLYNPPISVHEDRSPAAVPSAEFTLENLAESTNAPEFPQEAFPRLTREYRYKPLHDFLLAKQGLWFTTHQLGSHLSESAYSISQRLIHLGKALKFSKALKHSGYEIQKRDIPPGERENDSCGTKQEVYFTGPFKSVQAREVSIRRRRSLRCNADCARFIDFQDLRHRSEGPLRPRGEAAMVSRRAERGASDGT